MLLRRINLLDMGNGTLFFGGLGFIQYLEADSEKGSVTNEKHPRPGPYRRACKAVA